MNTARKIGYEYENPSVIQFPTPKRANNKKKGMKSEVMPFEVEDIKKTLADVGLEGVENINYLQAIKRVIGMINKPLAN